MKPLASLSLLLTAGAALVGACGGQPKTPCGIISAQFAARLTYTAGPESCRARVAEIFAGQSYARSVEDQRPSLERAPVALLPARIYDHLQRAGADPDPQHRPTAEGEFTTTYPDDRGICPVVFTVDAVQDLAAAAAIAGDPEDLSTFDAPALPATSYRYHFSEVEVYVGQGAVGTQMRGNLTVTLDGEACSYAFRALSPAVICGDLDPADSSHRTTIRNDGQCTSAAADDLVRQKTIGSMPVGTYINPDYPAACEQTPTLDVQGYPTQFVCLLPDDSSFPALR